MPHDLSCKHESMNLEKIAQAYLLPLSGATLWHMGHCLSVPFRAFVVRIIDSKSSSSKFISDLKAMSLYLRLLGGHVSLFATVAISEPPLEPRKLQVAEAATATGSSIHFPKFVLVQTVSNSYSYIVSRCCLFYPFLFFSLRALL